MQSRLNVMMHRVRLRRKSSLHTITVEDRAGVRTLQFTDVVQSAMRLDSASAEGLEYADLLHIAFALKAAQNALLIGLGGATLPKQWLLDHPALEIDVVEIDPVVVEIAREHFGFEPSPRCRIHLADGVAFVQSGGASWDLIVVDAYTIADGELAAPPAMVSDAFFEAAARRLSSGGILAFNCAAAPANRFTQDVRRTISHWFAHGLLFESKSSDNTVLLASASPLERRPDKLLQLIRRELGGELIERRSLLRRVRQLVDSW